MVCAWVTVKTKQNLFSPILEVTRWSFITLYQSRECLGDVIISIDAFECPMCFLKQCARVLGTSPLISMPNEFS